MFEELEEVEQRYRELNSRLADPDVADDPETYQKLAKEHAQLEEVVELYDQYREVERELEENRELSRDDDEAIREMARREVDRLEEDRARLEDQLKELLVPEDPMDEKDTLLEIRAGTGGEEAALFAADLFRMYSRYAEEKGWDLDIVDSNTTGKGGFKEIIALIEGDDVYRHLKYEAGVHRVQRVPETESSGRIHTSAVTVAVLPEARDVDVEIDPADLEVESFRSSGPGGQHANTTDSAIRVEHLPTGTVVTCQDEASQHKNKAKAMRVLSARLLEKKREEQQRERAESRRGQVGSGDRSERIRTYNFPQSRITDHRIDHTTYRLEQVLDGDVDEVLDPLQTHYRAEALKQMEEGEIDPLELARPQT
ncbi:MAG: peptide chain release factor 1 [Bradymonadaceae bacterium]